ncbi:sigma-70 family RNA polymerase sigma factor [Sphingomonas sp. DT-204]|uniref:sigma-70 family RNA polymerase sigma factor n=1 Tax=Sphingomonas sp. DT-204 TaxID=3396166 RepID=UPI003F1E3C08
MTGHGAGLDVVLDPARVEAALWRRAKFEQDLASRETLFNRYRLLARSIAVRYARRRRPESDRGDVEQLAYEGLLRALDRFDPLQGVPFGAYARRRIGEHITEGVARLSDLDAQVSLRRRLQRERLRSFGIRGESEDPLATLADLAVDLAIGLMLEGTGMIEGRDTRRSAYEGLAWRQAQAALASEIARLPQQQAIVVRQHYHHGLSFAHIAELLRLSRGRISQLHRDAVDRLRRRLRNY